jgi:hypothetical protein
MSVVEVTVDKMSVNTMAADMKPVDEMIVDKMS